MILKLNWMPLGHPIKKNCQRARLSFSPPSGAIGRRRLPWQASFGMGGVVTGWDAWKYTKQYMDVSENRCTPKSSILIGFSIINHPFLGYPYFLETPICTPENLVIPRNISGLFQGYSIGGVGSGGLQKRHFSTITGDKITSTVLCFFV